MTEVIADTDAPCDDWMTCKEVHLLHGGAMYHTKEVDPLSKNRNGCR